MFYIDRYRGESVPVLLTGRLLVQWFWTARRLDSTAKRGPRVPARSRWV